jgi:hypothetical protein
MTDKPRAKLTPQQQELVRKMREVDEAARGERERAPRKLSFREITCLVVIAVVFILLVLAVWAYFSAMRGLGEAIFFRG